MHYCRAVGANKQGDKGTKSGRHHHTSSLVTSGHGVLGYSTLPVYTAGKRVVVLEDYTLEHFFQSLRWQTDSKSKIHLM